MKTDAKIDPRNKVVLIDAYEGVFVPKYLYYLCNKILWADHKFDDWEEWTVKLRDADYTIRRLRDMNCW